MSEETLWWVAAGYPRNLVAAVCQVMSEVKAVPKTGHNKYDGYKYASDQDLATAIQPALAKAGLMLVPVSVESLTSEAVATKGGGSAFRCVMTYRYKLEHVSGESVTVESVGVGQDRTDKDAYKAMTGAWKYAVTQAFNLPRGDDPEGGKQQDEPEAPQAKPVKTIMKDGSGTKTIEEFRAMVLPSGKYQGKTLAECPDDYLHKLAQGRSDEYAAAAAAILVSER